MFHQCNDIRNQPEIYATGVHDVSADSGREVSTGSSIEKYCESIFVRILYNAKQPDSFTNALSMRARLRG